jgi:hypothetical protein
MSEMAHFKGQLVPLTRPEGMTLEEQMKDVAGITEVKSYYDSLEEQFLEAAYKKFAVIDDTIYRIEMEDVYYDDIFESNFNDDGTISFETKYYNGGCSFYEALGYALKSDNHA